MSPIGRISRAEGFVNFGSTLGDTPTVSASVIDVVDQKAKAVAFRGIEAGPGILIDVVDADDSQFITPDKKIVISSSGGPGGEANDGVNLGGGEGIFTSKLGIDLQFKSLTAGTGISLVATGTEIEINAGGFLTGLVDDASPKLGANLDTDGYEITTTSGNLILNPATGDLILDWATFPSADGSANQVLTTNGSGTLLWKTVDGTNLGTGAGEVYAGVTGTQLEFRNIKAGSNISIFQSGTDITLSGPTPGETNTGSNVGTAGIGIFNGKSGVDLEFKKLNATSNKISITNDIVNEKIDFNVSEANFDLANMGGVLTVAQGGTGASTFTSGGVLIGNGTSALQVTAAPTAAETFLKWNGSSFVWSVGPTGMGEANTASNVGVGGVGVFKAKSGVDLQFRSINAASNKITVALDGSNNEIDLDVDPSNISLNDLGGTLTVSKGGTGANTFETNGLLFGNGTGAIQTATAPTVTDTYLKWNGSTFEWAAGTGSGETNTASNLGAGEGVFAQKTGADLEFKSLVAGTNVTITSDANEITINSTATGGDPDQNLWETIVADSGSTTADNTTDSLSIVGGTGISTSIAGDTLTITATGGGAGEANDGANVGTGLGKVYRDKTGTTLNFKSIAAGSGIAVTNGADDVTVDVDIDSLSEITTVDTGSDFLVILDATDSTLKKVKPSNLGIGAGAGPTTYTLKVNYDSANNLSSLDVGTLPGGWSHSVGTNTLTLTFSEGAPPNFITYWGYDGTNNKYRYRTPTSAGTAEATAAGDIFTVTPSSITLNIPGSTVGATPKAVPPFDTHAYIILQF